MATILLAIGVLLLFFCDLTLHFANLNLQEIVILLAKIANHQEAAHPLPPRMPDRYNEP